MSTSGLACLLILWHLEVSVSNVDPVLRTASTHPMRYYVAAPGRMPPPGERLPVLVCLAGADSNFKALIARFARARGERPFLLVAPCTFSNANALRGEVRQWYTDLYSE